MSLCCAIYFERCLFCLGSVDRKVHTHMTAKLNTLRNVFVGVAAERLGGGRRTLRCCSECCAYRVRNVVCVFPKCARCTLLAYALYLPYYTCRDCAERWQPYFDAHLKLPVRARSDAKGIVGLFSHSGGASAPVWYSQQKASEYEKGQLSTVYM